MHRNKLRLLVVGYSEPDADLLYSELVAIIDDLNYKPITKVLDIHTALYESEWDALISNHAMPSFDFMDALNVLKESDKVIPFIVYSTDIDEKIISTTMYSGADDYVQKGNAIQLVFSIRRELKNKAIHYAKLQAEVQIYRLAYYDELTGLPKRNLFCKEVSVMLSNRPHLEAIAAIYFININRLPHINSTYGYGVGDTLIQQLTRHLLEYAGKNCLLTRVEGSKFAYFNGDVANSSDIHAFLNRIMELAATPFMVNNLEFYITFNMGICVYPTDGKDISMLLASAESAMLLSRNLWQNNYRFYIKEIGEASAKRLKLERSLRKSIEKQELLVYYQPIVDMQTGSITGTEALVRWDHPEFGLLSPDNFIPLAHETGFIIDIGKWVLKQACLQTKLWHRAGYDSMSISVNISAIELDQSQLLNHIENILAETDLFPAALELEITESVLMHDAEASVRILQELKKMGIKIAVDDFGTGYSSLSYLKRFPIDILKIDRSFARDIVIDSDSSTIVTTIIALARSLGLSVLAEGVETKEQFDFLYQGQCDRAQGYLFSRPIGAENLFSLLRQPKTGTLA
ncbi:diguanylate cyclase (GGDEF) domain-containing protein [Nitrosomonas cryotolerans]|uniref:Diguanylate cyclase (GGDEF) domain-containing protein n=1 Tax=Nitrosomonas cryotolerans ATCC 49181 TaxID=1131553 RepID=A0A1N6ISD9_9PROT|nr:GGDEF domain-containing response regulator [Nitrosomonas cryotolerans]SFP33427.1 diguanylate cyclase (GGDEF) domain-containing protein [Nitrosomonas cryotolerans]SIO34903.1 diguanylate cyclase (GGDEF) domain-containing protein [Nitrosomonas cryotolerans ATCC 49181]